MDRAFSNVVADNQYATLGLMLMGTLARVQSVIRPLGKEVEEIGEVDEEIEILEEKGDADDGADLGEVITREEVELVAKVEKDKDVGEDEIKLKTTKKKRKIGVVDSSAKKTIEATPSKRPKKKRKKGDAFDDLFDTLL